MAKAKSPFSDEVDFESTDPSNLFTGSGSQMFRNERMFQENTKAAKLKAKRAQEQSQLIPVANDLLEELDKIISANADIRSYMLDPKTKKTKEAILIEFRARELNIKLAEQVQGWIRNRLRQNEQIQK